MVRSNGKRTYMRSEAVSVPSLIGRSRTADNMAVPTLGTKGRSLHLRVDVPLLLVLITLLLTGLVMVYSASYDFSLWNYNDPTYIFYRQAAFMGLGVGIAAVLMFVDYHIWRKLALPAMVVTVISLFGVLITNNIRNGAVRTLLGGSVQPSELAKLVTIIYLAVWLYAKRERLGDISFGLIPLAGILGVVGGLIYIQPDLSALITILFLGGIMFFLAGGDLRQIGLLMIFALVIAFLVVQFSATGGERMATYLAGLKDPVQGASYHVRRALEAFAKGGWFGVGIGKGLTKLTGLPVPPTDSIFAVIGEETGVFGALIVVGMYIMLLWRGLSISARAPDRLGSVLAAGLTLWIATEAFINMAVMVNLLPFAGNALPFISSGGSNLVVSLTAMGILLNISRLSVQNEEAQGRLFGAAIDLRRWDRRRRVSRTNRSAGTKQG
jgi:cell division protein FtsW